MKMFAMMGICVPMTFVCQVEIVSILKLIATMEIHVHSIFAMELLDV